MNYINVNWKKVSMGFAQGRRYAEDRDTKHRGDSEANRVTRQKIKGHCLDNGFIRNQVRNMGLFKKTHVAY